MSLRARLVIALAVLLTAGLALFGVATYGAYSSSLYQRLDDRLRNALPLITNQLVEDAGLKDEGPSGDGRDDGKRGAAPIVTPSGTYGELRDRSGTVLASLQTQAGSTTAQPDVPADLPAAGRIFDADSTSGSTAWRLLVAATDRPPGYVVVAAVPTNEVTTQLNRLVLIEALGGAVLLLVVASGSWLVLRRGLRPLEAMAESAGRISSGALTERVSPADGRTEVGQLGLALNTMLDEIEEAFQERDATEQRLRQFLADASHELRTPLTSIQGFAELFRLQQGDPNADPSVGMRRIEQEALRMRTLVDDLLLLARLDRTRAAESAPVDLTVLAADGCTDLAAVDRSRPITFDAPGPVVVQGDERHLRQAIANLLTNAAKHTAPGTAVDVTVSADGSHGVLRVRDHGSGLDEEALAHVFDRFWQADRARVGTGSGLGLSIVDGIAREHGGRVDAANHPGGGAVFTVRLPLAEPPRSG